MFKNPLSVKITQAKILLQRLEKISADSRWSHQASGIRASLAKTLASITTQSEPAQVEKLDLLMGQGYQILEKVAREIPEDFSPL
jgi:hypothetical protein